MAGLGHSQLVQRTGAPQLFEGMLFDLAGTLPGDPQGASHLLERLSLAAVQAEPQTKERPIS